MVFLAPSERGPTEVAMLKNYRSVGSRSVATENNLTL